MGAMLDFWKLYAQVQLTVKSWRTSVPRELYCDVLLACPGLPERFGTKFFG